jgi:hypothetical protein
MKIEKIKPFEGRTIKFATSDRSNDLIWRLEDKINEIIDVLDIDLPDDYYKCECGCEWFEHTHRQTLMNPPQDIVICRDCKKRQYISKHRLPKAPKYKRYGIWKKNEG